MFAVGSSYEDVGSVHDAGVVHIVPSDRLTLEPDPAGSLTVTRATIGGTPVAGDRFGAAVLLVDVDADNDRDLIIGAPGVDHEAGRVYVVRYLAEETRFDLAHPVVLQQGRAGLLGTSEAGDRFGAALHFTDAGVFDPYLAIGAPGEDIRAAYDAGAVTLVTNATETSDDAVYYQGSGLPGTPETDDEFGFSLGQFRTGLAVGAPGEDVLRMKDAGDVTGFYRSDPGSGVEFHQGANGVPGINEAGDHFGAALVGGLDAVTIGIPGEDIGDAVDAGAIVDLNVPGACCVETTLWYEGLNGLAGQPESGDRFGAALGVGHGRAVGVPGQDVAGTVDAGLIHVIGLVEGHGTLSGDEDVRYTQDSRGVPGTAEAGDQFGASFGQLYSILLVGTSREDVHGSADGGAVVMLGLNEENGIIAGPNTRQVTQDDLAGSTAEPGDRFGAGLSHHPSR
jgi:hypothetical protein